MKKAIIICASAFVAMSCVTKPYKTPEVAKLTDSLYRVLEMAVDTTANEADVSWRTFFTDPTLVNYIDEAINNNIDMQVAVKNVQKAEAQLRQSRAAFYPSVNAALGGSITSQSNLPMSAAYNVNGQASWEIDIWGKIASSKRSAYAQVLAQEDTRQALQTSIVAQIATMYYTLVAYDTELEVIKRTIITRRKYAETTQALKESAKVNEVAVQQAIAQLKEVEAALPNLELAIIQLENSFRLLLGKPSGSIVRHTMIDIMDAKLVTLIGYPAQLLANRPDVRAAENNYRSAFELWNMSRAAMYPSLTISAEGSVSDIFESHFGILNLLGGLTQPIFNGRKLRTQKEVNKLSAEQAELSFRKTLLVAGQEVSDALSQQVKTQQKAVAQVSQFKALQLAYDYSMELFINGYATYLDVLMAQTGVFNIEMSLIQTYLDNLNARIEIYRALGGGRM